MITGIILAGGAGARLQADKTLLTLRSRRILEIVIDALRGSVDEIIIVSSAHRDIPDAGCLTTAVTVTAIRDVIADHGSLGGIYSGLRAAANPYSFVVGCDMPFLNPGLVRYLASRADPGSAGCHGPDIIIPKIKNQFETLAAIYSKTCIPFIEAQLQQHNLRIFDFFPQVSVREINENEIRTYDPDLRSFFNINTPSDYAAACRMWNPVGPGANPAANL